MTRSTTTPERGPLRIAALIAFLFAALYAVSIGPDPLNIHWFNVVFDADPSRVRQDALAGQDAATFDRHPLFGILVGAPARLLDLLGVPDPVGLLTALLGGLGVGVAFLLFRAICKDNRAAALFAILYGCAPPIWLLASIPETFVLSAGLMLLLMLRREQQPEAPGWKRKLGDALVAAASVGVAVPNAVYVAIAHIRKTVRAGALLRFGGAALAVYAGLGLLQAVFIPGSRNVVLAPVRAVLGDPYVREANAPDAATVTGNFIDFVAHALVAPAPVMKVVPTTLGAMQMLQFGAARWTWVVACVVFLVAIVALTLHAPLREVWRNPTVRVALGFLAFNLVFHAVYRANGQPFIFTAHTVGPLLVLIAALYAASALPGRIAVLAVVTGVVVVNNALFIGDVRAALSAPCASKVGLVCVKWTSATDNARYSDGVDRFLTSGDYPFELARSALERGVYPDATAQLKRALRIEPGHRLALQYLGFTYLRAGRPDSALPLLERASAAEPRNAIVRSLLREARGEVRAGDP
jgi:hypothetical protein